MSTKSTKLQVTLVKSIIGSNVRQKRTLAALGLRKMHQTVEHNATPNISGMIRCLSHLLKVKEV